VSEYENDPSITSEEIQHHNDLWAKLVARTRELWDPPAIRLHEARDLALAEWGFKTVGQYLSENNSDIVASYSPHDRDKYKRIKSTK